MYMWVGAGMIYRQVDWNEPCTLVAFSTDVVNGPEWISLSKRKDLTYLAGEREPETDESLWEAIEHAVDLLEPVVDMDIRVAQATCGLLYTLRKRDSK